MIYQLEKGVFILSLDTELAWGTRGRSKYTPHFSKTRETIDMLLSLMGQYKIKATWAVVGHLFLDHCQPINGVKHPEIIQSRYARLQDDWFNIDPATNLISNPEWYGKDIVEKILKCPVKQEIGCHTFSHIIVDEAGCAPECFASELEACQNLAANFGLELKSFVFPQNKVGRLEILKEHNFICYRGEENNWYKKLPGNLKKIAHGIDNYLMFPSPTATPQKRGGLWNLAGSYFYVHSDGWARFLPVSFRVFKVKAGINKAVEEKTIFHLWFHPFNIASNPKGLLRGLAKIFSYVDLYRQKKLLDNLTMGELAESLNSFI